MRRALEDSTGGRSGPRRGGTERGGARSWALLAAGAALVLGCKAQGRALHLTIDLGGVQVPSFVTIVVEELGGPSEELGRLELRGEDLFPDDNVVVIVPNDGVTALRIGAFGRFDDSGLAAAVWTEGCKVVMLAEDRITTDTVSLGSDPVPYQHNPYNGEVVDGPPVLRWTAGVCELNQFELELTDDCPHAEFEGCTPAVVTGQNTTAYEWAVGAIDPGRHFWRLRACSAAFPDLCTDWPRWHYYDIGRTAAELAGGPGPDLAFGAGGTNLPGMGPEDAGSAYIVETGGVPPWAVVRTIRGGPMPEAFFGDTVTMVGDVDANGLGDVAIGAPRAPGTEGVVFLLLNDPGLPADLDAGDLVRVDNPNAGEPGGGAFGASIAAAGDVNGDGYADVLVGDPLFEEGGLVRGRAYLFAGSADGFEDPAEIFAPGSVPPEGRFGAAVASAGDVNGDGLADMLVGAPVAPMFAGDRLPIAFVFYGSYELGLYVSEVTDLMEFTPGPMGSAFGVALAGAGDLDGDGLSDVVIGQPGVPSGAGPEVGLVSVYLTAPQGSLPYEPTLILVAPAGAIADSRFGANLVKLPDSTGDGVPELLVGAPGFDSLAVPGSVGRVFLFDGANVAAGMTAGQSLVAALQNPDDAPDFGGPPGVFALAAPGDLCGDDGLVDVAVGGLGHAGGTGVVWAYCSGSMDLLWDGATGNPLGAPLILESDAGGDSGTHIGTMR